MSRSAGDVRAPLRPRIDRHGLRERGRRIPVLACRLEDGRERDGVLGVVRLEIDGSPRARLGRVGMTAGRLGERELAQDHGARRRDLQRRLQATVSESSNFARRARLAAGVDLILHVAEPHELEPASNRVALRIDREDALHRGDRLVVVVQAELGLGLSDERRNVPVVPRQRAREVRRRVLELPVREPHESEARLGGIEIRLLLQQRRVVAIGAARVARLQAKPGVRRAVSRRSAAMRSAGGMSGAG